MPLKPATRRMLCALAGSFIALGAANPACGKPRFVNIISVVPQPFWTTLKLFQAEPKVSLILLAPSFVRQAQPDYAAANGVNFSALAGFNDTSNDGFAPIVVVDEKTKLETAPANVDPGNGPKSLGSSPPGLADNWSRIAGVGSTIPTYSTGFGTASNNSSATPDSSQSQLAGSDVRQSDRETDQATSTVTKDGTQSVPLAGPDRGSQSLRHGGTVSIGGITLSGGDFKLASIQRVTPKALTFGGGSDAPDASAQWNGTTNSTWSTSTNWSAGGPPGTGETATFNNAGNGNTTISLNNITINTILFDASSAAAYTMGIGGAGSQNINLDNSGAIIVNSAVTNNQLFNAKLTLGNGNVTTSFSFTNNSTSGTLTFAGAIDTNPGIGNHPTWTLNLAGSGNGTISGAISGTGAGNGSGAQALVSIFKSGAGTWTLSGTNTYAGGTNINGGILSLGSSGALGSSGTISFGGGTLRYSASNTTDYSGRFSGAASQAYSIDTNGQSVTLATALTSSGGTLTKLGSGQLNLTGAVSNTYTGLTTVSAGTLGLGKNASINAFGGDLMINGGAVIYSAANDNQIIDSAKVTISSGSLAFGGRNETIGSTGTSGLALNGGAITIGSGNIDVANSISMTGGTITLTAGSGRFQANTEFNFSGGVIDFTSGSGTSTAALNLRGGTGTGITYSASGTSTALITNSGGGSARVSLNTSGTTVFNIADAASVATEMSIGVTISGSTALQKSGAGVLLLSGANTYGGGSQVNAGTLLANNTTGSATGTGAVTVNNSGTVLGGTGTIAGGVTVNGNAILQGGNGTTGTTLTLSGALTLADNSIIQLVLGPSGTHSTLARTGSGTWTFDSNQAFNFTNVQSGTYDNIITGLAANPGMTADWIVLNSGWNGTFTFDGMGGVDLTLTAVPEPSTWVASALALLAVGYTQRRRFKSATVFVSAA